MNNAERNGFPSGLGSLAAEKRVALQKIEGAQKSSMYLLYVDESGDIGINGSPSRYFVLSGFVVHELKWNETLETIITFRKHLRNKYGLKLREEIHSAVFIHKPGEMRRIAKSLRLRILREAIDFQAALPDINIINIVVDKSGKAQEYDVFDTAWSTLVQRFHNTISYRNFPGPQNAQDFGLLVVDQTDEKKLRNLVRKMRKYNPIPNRGGVGYRSMPITTLVEDAVHRNSLHSYFIQLADINAFFLFQYLDACKYIRKKGARNYFVRLDPVLCKVASANNPLGVVYR
jgi:hypothetical protein